MTTIDLFKSGNLRFSAVFGTRSLTRVPFGLEPFSLEQRLAFLGKI